MADSIRDYGTANWSYGYSVASDATHVFHSLSQRGAFPNWTHVDPQGQTLFGPPWTSVSSGFSHPNGGNSYGAEFAVTRWTSPITARLQVTIRLAKLDVTCGNGTEAILFQNGVEKVRTQVAFDDSVGKLAVVTVDVVPNDKLDAAVGAMNNDNCDSSAISMTLVQVVPGMTYADSVSDFGNTANNGWSYGTYAGTTHTFSANLSYEPSLSSWRHGAVSPPWTMISENAAHPNNNNSLEEVAVRRWTSNASDYVQVSVHVAKGSTCGNGVVPSVYQNGLLLGLWQLAADNTVGYSGIILTHIQVGDTLDFAVAANGDDSCDLTVFTARIASAPSAGTILSDSVLQFSSSQGGNGWEYGYVATNVDGSYSPLPFFDPSGPPGEWSHNGSFPPNSPWWTAQTDTGMHPNANPLEDAVRRWTSNVAGPVRINWHVAKNQVGCGDGTWAYLYVGGQRNQTIRVPVGDLSGFDSSFDTILGIGSQVDFRVAAGPPPETSSNDGCDGTELRANVVARDPAGPLLVSASGYGQVIQVAFGDLAGIQPITVARIKFNASDGSLICEVSYTAATGAIGVTAGGGCAVNPASAAVGVDSTLQVTFDLVFSAPDPRAVLSRSVERAGGASTGWVSVGIWPIGAANLPPCSATMPLREYVRLSGRLVAIENRQCNVPN